MKAVILAGGCGTRLWPLSTKEKPKQFHKLCSDKTMLEEAVLRVNFLKNEDIYIAINRDHLELTKKLCPQIPRENIIIEPVLRDTAAAIGYSTKIIEDKFPESVMAIIYADQWIKNTENFQKYLKIAAKIAEKQNTLNIIEVPATSPHTGYGYVKLSQKTDTIDGTEIYQIDSFKEKPDEETAKKFVKEENYLWNTGIYVWKSSVLLEYFKKYQPKTHEALMQMTSEEKVEAIYPTLEKISLDYAIMEKVPMESIRIIKAENLGWSDIGDFEALHEELPKNDDGNILRGNIKSHELKNSLVIDEENKEIKILGLSDIVIINTKDGLLVSKKSLTKQLKILDK
ncbi:mannose-1-phosphate guanylyltransferase [Candidatus Peregrinibacteria bacterium]|nr:mannose-1-phosphate guanylyltransferase [Candidatus Peregrinibacteria bacterium]